jgi:lysophospholipase L1-like esterase
MHLRLPACVIAVVVAAAVALATTPLQARPINIVAIGASNTSGLGVGEQNAYDPDPVPRDFYQWDGIHFNAAAHAKIAATLAAQITAAVKPAPSTQTAAPAEAPPAATPANTGTAPAKP